MPRPNFIIFITDDQGYGDLSCMGNTDFRTPHLDRLASSGARFTSFYANSPVCSPSRAALLTGRYPGNAGVRSILAGHRHTSGLHNEVPTLARALKDLGYRTAMSGKWHLGSVPGCRPPDHGFDQWFGFLAGCVDYYSHIFYWDMNRGGPGNDPVHDLWRDDAEVWRNGEYLTHLITGHAVDMVRRFAAEEEPFFLYIAYNAPHYPMHAPQEYLDRFPHLPWDRQIMAAMLSAVDDGVGEVLAELDRQGLSENTAVFFMADNGPSRETRNWLDGTTDPYYGGSAGQLKGHKFSLYEGGIRVPGIMSWPGRFPAGQVLDQAVAAMDIFPTFLQAAGGYPVAYTLDGVDVLPLLAEGQPLPERDLFWEIRGQTAIRRGPWKLVLNGQLVEGAPPEDEVYFANLDEDLGERHNRKDENADLAADLLAAAESWRAGIVDRWTSYWEPRLRELVPADD